MQMAAHWAKTAAVPDVKATLNKNCIESQAQWLGDDGSVMEQPAKITSSSLSMVSHVSR